MAKDHPRCLTINMQAVAGGIVNILEGSCVDYSE
jgi:hypothetical protein